LWLTKDLRSSGKTPAECFADLLKEFGSQRDESSNPIPIAVTIDAGVLDSSLSPFANNTNSPQGLSYDDLVGIARVAGSDPNVSASSLESIL
jgi:arginase family enzyme